MSAARTIATMLIVAGALSTSAAAAEDVKISLTDLPAPVRQAVEQNLLGGTIKGVSKEIEKGQTFYEIETIRSGHARDLLFDAEGHLVAVEEVVALDAVPAAVRTALSALGKVTKVETVTKGADVSYEAVIESGGKKREVMVDGTGKPMP